MKVIAKEDYVNVSIYGSINGGIGYKWTNLGSSQLLRLRVNQCKAKIHPDPSVEGVSCLKSTGPQ